MQHLDYFKDAVSQAMLLAISFPIRLPRLLTHNLWNANNDLAKSHSASLNLNDLSFLFPRCPSLHRAISPHRHSVPTAGTPHVTFSSQTRKWCHEIQSGFFLMDWLITSFWECLMETFWLWLRDRREANVLVFVCVVVCVCRCWRAWWPTHGQLEQRAVTWPTPCWTEPTV